MASLRRRDLLVSSAALAAASCSETDSNPSQSSNETEGEYDYVVIGSGAGGGPLAANLARAGHKVLLLEAGEDHGESDTYKVPALHPQSTEDPAMRWDFWVDHYGDAEQAARDSKFREGGVLYPRAGTLGGCTAHNALVTVYPHASDWDHIAELTGDASWRAVNMRRYFEILEHCDYLGKNDDREGHGFAGWLHTRQPDARIALQDPKLLKIVSAAAMEVDEIQGGGFLGNLSQSLFHNELLGLMKRDLNGGSKERDQTEGLFTIPLHARGGQRSGPRDFIVETVAQGFPLTVKTGAFVTRIHFSEEKDEDGKVRATAVEYLVGKHLYRADPGAVDRDVGETELVTPKLEIIVSCGVFNTPQLLKLSGIGPAAELKDHGIDVIVDLPGVGENLQDRYEVGVVSEVSQDFKSLNGCTAGAPGDPCLEAWRQDKGVYRNNGTVVALVKKSSDLQPDPDLIIFGLPADFRGYYPGYSSDLWADYRHFTWAILKGHTRNTAGTVKLRSTDPLDTPAINFKYFHEGTAEGADIDLEAMVEGVKLARRIGDRVDDVLLFSKFEEVWPGREADDDEAVRTWVKDEAWGHHASCTCKIGADDDPTAVLDSEFRVRGTTGLRVVDASIFPRIPGFFIVVPIYMIAEKATDVILAAIGESRP